MLAYSAT